jgi:hypothetical protein
VGQRRFCCRGRQPTIIVSKFGNVKANRIGQILEIMKECYYRLMPHDVIILDLCVFERSSSLDAFLRKEYREVGVVSAPFDELFFAMHDAWRGTPRISLCLERMEKLPRSVWLGGIRHEVGHSVLHGNLQYYLIPMPVPLLTFADRFDLSRDHVTSILYLISIAVKDYEVTRLLHERGYAKDQKAYAKHLLVASESDRLSWHIARGNPLAEILCLVSCLKSAAVAAALLDDDEFGREMQRHLTESLHYIPAQYRLLLLEIVFDGFPMLEKSTLNNIYHITHRCKSFFDMTLESHNRSARSK